MKKPTVWVTQRREGLNFDAAAALGDVLFMTDGEVHPADLGTIHTTCQDVASQFSKDDFVVPVASVTGCVVMGCLFAALVKNGIKQTNLLIFDAKSCSYKERILAIA